MRKKLFTIMALTIFSNGCIPFMTNDQNTAIWVSKEKRIESFKREQDLRLGKEFYTPVPESDWCKTNQCLKVEDSIMEYIERPIRKDDSSGKCVIAWRVDAKQSTGNYQHGTGPVYYGLGKRLNWRYISNPEDCLTTLNFWGPFL